MLDVGWPRDSWEAIVARIAAARPEPRWEPGRKAGYHTASSWFVLGEVIRRLAGRPFERAVREEVFEPLGMASCWIGMPPERWREAREAGRLGARPANAGRTALLASIGTARKLSRLGVMWDTAAQPPRPHDWESEEQCVRPNPGGNGRGPMRELARLYEMLLGRGMLDGARLLTPQTVEALTARHRVGLLDHTFRHQMDWGLGFILDSKHYGVATVPYGYGRHASPRTFGHSGKLSSTAFADPEHGLAVALLYNGTPAEADHEQRLTATLDGIYEDLGLAAAS
jgi:CubicO group peptidase (beta-lactamase class C family)